MNLSLLSCRWIDFGSKEYHQTLALRNEVLRKPLGLNFTKDQLLPDSGDWHLGVFLENECIACLILSKLNDKNVVKMRQVAVNKQLQGQGIGKMMVVEAERRSNFEKVESIELNARSNAIEFYQSQNYTLIGDWFTEVGIPHKKMIKPLQLP